MLSEIYGYASRVKDQDTADAAGQTLSARAMGLYVECSGLISFADPEILSIPEEKLEAFYAEKPELLKYRRSINEVRRSYFIAGAGKDTGRCRGDGAGTRNGLFVFGKCRPDL